MMKEYEHIDYLEFPSKDLEATRNFFSTVFGWTFVDYGPDYLAFSDAGINGGFFKSDLTVTTKNGSVLVVFYSRNLEDTQARIEQQVHHSEDVGGDEQLQPPAWQRCVQFLEVFIPFMTGRLNLVRLVLHAM